MIFVPTAVEGAYRIEPEMHRDHRGSFTRVFCRREFEEQGLEPFVAQASLSFNARRGTHRGMLYQAAPAEEVKVMRCVRGAIHDVVLDLRPESPTYLRHDAVVLSAENHLALYIPAGCAHGFQTLEDDTEVLYQMSEFYTPELGRGVRWDDPAFGIEWPLPEEAILLERDASYPDYVPSPV